MGREGGGKGKEGRGGEGREGREGRGGKGRGGEGRGMVREGGECTRGWYILPWTDRHTDS